MPDKEQLPVDVAQEDPPMVEIENMDQLILLLNNWHSRKKAEMEHMLSIPDDGHVSIQFSGYEEMHLEGDTLKGFLAGIAVSLMTFDTLPIGFIPEEAALDLTDLATQVPVSGEIH